MKTTSANVLMNDSQSSSIARGSRLEVLRRMVRLTRREFAEKHGISANTIQSWETGKSGGLTFRGAQRIIPVFHLEGIFCTVDWLMHGVGQPPQLTNLQFLEAPAPPSFPHTPDTDAITRELLTFRNTHPNAIDLIVNDDGMAPWYKKGDYVAGIRRTDAAIQHLVHEDCIVQTKNNEVLLRRIKNNSQANLYDLVCINLASQVPLSTLYAQALIWAAPVIWLRRPDTLAIINSPD